MDLSRILFILGCGFLLASVRLFYQFIRFLRLKSSAVLTWPGRRPPFYGLLLGLGAVLSILILYKLAVLRFHPTRVFGEAMMLVYYGYAVPLSQRISRGFYENGIWSDGGFVPYSAIGGLAWREGEQLTLVLIDRMRHFGRKLTVPESCYAAARRVLHDKIQAHDIYFTGQPLDLGGRDVRDDV